MEESDIKREICDYLIARGIFHWIQQAGRIPGRRARGRSYMLGIPDVLGIYNGRLLAIEVKTHTGKASPEQIEFLTAARTRGACAFLARSVNDVELGLRQFDLSLAGESRALPA
jgi:Holliday junction resolvase